MNTEEKTLPELLGIDTAEGQLDLEAVANRLIGGHSTDLILPPNVWGAPLVRCFDLYREPFKNPDADTMDQMCWDLQAMAELFASSGWRTLHGNTNELMLLGHDHSERDSEIDDQCVPDVWLASGWWQTIAIAGEWRLLTHAARNGTLVRLSMSDEGYTFAIWMFAHGSL